MEDADYYDLDEFAIPTCVQSTGFKDGADAAADVGTLLACGEYKWIYFLGLFVWDLIPVRCPHRKTWDGQRDRFSRDQLIAMLCGFLEAVRNYGPQVKNISDIYYTAHKKHFFLYAWNTRGNGAMDKPEKMPDITGPATWALWARIYKFPFRRLYLWALDLENAVNIFRWRFDDTRITRNYMLIALKSYEFDPTWVSRLVFKFTPWEDLITRWRDNCRATRGYQTAYRIRSRYEKLRDKK